MAGKGSRPRPVDAARYGAEYDRIFGARPRVERTTYPKANRGFASQDVDRANYGEREMTEPPARITPIMDIEDPYGD